MTVWLKQSTAYTLKFGPFVDSSDGVTPMTALTLSQADFRVSKAGGNLAQKNESSSATHDEIGFYDVAINTTDTNTLGSLFIAVNESGALPVWQYFMVVPANVWDSLFGADQLLVEVDAVSSAGLTSILSAPLTEPVGVFSWGTATLGKIIAWLGVLSRNKMTQNSVNTTLRNDADSADLATSPIDETAGTFTRGEWT